MSTPNFALKNASRYFVFGMPVYYTQEEIDERELDQDLLGEFDELDTEANYEADKENVACELKAKGWHDIKSVTMIAVIQHLYFQRLLKLFGLATRL